MIKEIIKDEEILSVKCEPASADDAQIAEDLADTLLASDSAACLAANQIGETKRIVAYLNNANKPVVMFNPVIKMPMMPFETMEECLSRDEASTVTRYKLIRVEYEELVDGKLLARQKKLDGWSAQLVQHLVDHCEGVLV